MAEIVQFHHVLGRTVALDAIADRLREAGHLVHAPDLYDGQVFDTIEEGGRFAESIGVQTLMTRALAAVQGLPDEIVYLGYSMGTAPAQTLLQTRPGAIGGILMYACIDPASVGPWPEGVPVHIHAMKDDPYFAADAAAAKQLDAAHEAVSLFLYPGSGHLFMEAGHPDYDEEAAELAFRRIEALLASIDTRQDGDSSEQ